jgi:hypothetical protein
MSRAERIPDLLPMKPITGLSRIGAFARERVRAEHQDFDWGAKPRIPLWLSRRGYANILADLCYGEWATAEACQRMAGLLPEPEAQACLLRQRDDELAHAEIYQRYLQRLGVGVKVKPSPGLSEIYQRCLSWSGNPLALVLAFDVVLEGEALRLQRFFARRLPCPLFRQINRAILVDEARHVAFGRLYGTMGITALPAGERRALAKWLKTLWWDCARTIRSRNLGPGGWVLRAWHPPLDASWRAQSERLAAMGLFERDTGTGVLQT